MSSLIYHRAEVENAKLNGYTEFDNLDFYLNQEGRALQQNSLRIEGEVRVLKDVGGTTTRLETTDKVFIDMSVGANCFFDTMSVEFQNSGMIEHQSEVPRYYKMTEIGSKDRNDYHNGNDLIQLKSPSPKGATTNICGTISANNSADAGTAGLDGDNIDNSFSIKPKFCLNKMSDDMSFSKSGFVKVSLSVAKVSSILFGVDEASSMTIQLRNVRVCYNSVPDVSNNLQMRTIIGLKSSINSTFSNNQFKVNGVCDGVSACFLRQDKENTLTQNNNDMDVLSGINEISWLFNDSTAQYISYVIQDKGEMIRGFVDSLKNSGHNQVNSNHNNSNFGLGLTFPPTDLTQQKFNLQINSSNPDISTSPYILYMFFHSVVSL
tara:strand:+ start:12614 stop:13747 length:1134 start_codon:yes stop_codon:yes gene_type:complete